VLGLNEKVLALQKIFLFSSQVVELVEEEEISAKLGGDGGAFL